MAVQPFKDYLTECKFLPRIRREGEAEQRHAGDEDTRNDQVEEVVQGSPADVDSEGDVHIWFRATVVCNRVFLARDAYSWNFNSAQDIKENCIGFLVIERTSY